MVVFTPYFHHVTTFYIINTLPGKRRITKEKMIYSRRQNPPPHGKLYMSIPFWCLEWCTLLIPWPCLKCTSGYWYVINHLYSLLINALKQAVLTVYVKQGYVYMGPMTNKNMCYMVMKTLGFDWLKNHREVILVMSENKSDVKGQCLCKALKHLIEIKISA